MTLADSTYVSLATFRRTGEPVATPVWVVALPDGRLGVWTNGTSGKVKRLGRDPRVTLQPCTVRGAVADGTALHPGTAVVSRNAEDLAQVRRLVTRTYGVLGWAAIHLRLSRADDTAVLITLDRG